MTKQNMTKQTAAAYVSKYRHMQYKRCKHCATMAKSNVALKCLHCHKPFAYKKVQNDQRGKSTKKCLKCGTMALSNRALSCKACSHPFTTCSLTVNFKANKSRKKKLPLTIKMNKSRKKKLTLTIKMNKSRKKELCIAQKELVRLREENKRLRNKQQKTNMVLKLFK